MSAPTFNELDRAVWRIVRDSEGLSSTRAVMGQLPGNHSPHVIGGALKRLKTAGHLRQRKYHNGQRYGFTTGCTPPDGESATPNTSATALEPLKGDALMHTATPPAGLPLTPEQMTQQVDLSLRLMQMALSGVPSPSEGVDLTVNELALHGLMTAYASMAAADAQLTYRAACALLSVSQELMRRHENRNYHAFAPSAPAPAH